jgi:hypothetical protein
MGEYVELLLYLMAWAAALAISAGGLMLALSRFRRHWPLGRRLLISAAALPGALWLVAFGIDMFCMIQQALYPAEGFMIGISIMAFPICVVMFLFGMLPALLALSLRDYFARAPS